MNEWEKHAKDFEEMYKQEHREKNRILTENQEQAEEIKRLKGIEYALQGFEGFQDHIKPVALAKDVFNYLLATSGYSLISTIEPKEESI